LTADFSSDAVCAVAEWLSMIKRAMVVAVTEKTLNFMA